MPLGETMIELSQSMEDYLEAIWIIYKKKKIVRVKDLVSYFSYKVSSVNNALKILIENGLIIHEKYEHIELTPEGTVHAGKLYKKHILITRFLSEILKVNEAIAEEDACVIEHHLNKQSYHNLIKFMDYIEKTRRTSKKWLEGFDKYLNGNKNKKKSRSGRDENSRNKK